MLDIGTRRVDRAADRRELRNRRREEPRDVDDGGAVASVRFDGQHGDHGSVVLPLHGLVDGERTVGRDGERNRAEDDAVADSLPVKRPRFELVAGIRPEITAGARRVLRRRASEAADNQHVLAEFARGNLEVGPVVQLVHREQSAFRFRFGRDHPGVRSRLRGNRRTPAARRVTLCRPAAASSATLRRARSRLRRRRDRRWSGSGR